MFTCFLRTVCVPFCAKLVVYCGFLEFICWKQLPAVAENDVMRAEGVNQNSDLDEFTHITMSDPFPIVTLFSHC